MLLQLCNACKSCLVLEAPSPADRRGEGTSRLQPLQHGALGVLQTVSRRCERDRVFSCAFSIRCAGLVPRETRLIGPREVGTVLPTAS